MSEELQEMADELSEAAMLCNDENGEWWAILADLARHMTANASKKFQKAYDRELRGEHERLKEDFRVVESVRTEEVKRLELMHVDEL